jgi:hypothetical protein
MQRRVSRFAVIGRAKEQSEDPLGDLDDAHAEAVMGELEREIERMDNDHPDPKHLGRTMRKMAELLGKRAPDTLLELVGRLEAGEDPEKLEDKFGMAEDPAGYPDGDSEQETDPDAFAALWEVAKKKWKLTQEPVRDPRLYELRDWL